MRYAIVWFRQDLRLLDNPAFYHANQFGVVIPLYVKRSMGGASQWWLHHSLTHLSEQLSALSCPLIVRNISAEEAILELVETLIQQDESAEITLFLNVSIDPKQREEDKKIEARFKNHPAVSLNIKAYNGSLLLHPSEVLNKQGSIFQIFTPYWRHCLGIIHVPPKLLIVKALESASKIYPQLRNDGITSLDLLPKKAWAMDWEEYWEPGEAGAAKALKHFLDEGISSYAVGRDYPDLEFTSRLSPHLHFGEISPRQVWIAAKQCAIQLKEENNVAKFLAELGWREFAHYMLFHQPSLVDSPFKPNFAKFPWQNNKAHFKSWQKGMTGYPIVDAGMRELWQTGFMHNRVRMIVASFLTKHLLIPWQQGAEWFMDTLVDADIANNTAGWQWVAGCGCDASPYFRIFNPVLQGQKFDPNGNYVRRWIPELKKCPDRYIHTPWDCPPILLKEHDIVLGKTYPKPIVDLEVGRQRALVAYKAIKS